MKTIFTIICMCLTSTASFAEVNVEYKVSKMHGLIDFVLTISGEKHHAPGVFETYKNSSYSKDAASIEKLKEFESVKNNLLYQNIGTDSKGIRGRHIKQNVDSIVIAQSMFAKNLNEFSERILGLLPKSDHLVLLSTLKFFEPIYSKLIWNKSLKELTKHKSLLEKLSNKVNLNQMFKHAETFYRAKWPVEVPFVIGLYPVPFIDGFKNSTVSHSMDSVEEHGVLIGSTKKDLNGSFGVIFHELCHSLYGSQSHDYMNEFEKYFSESQSLYKNQAYDWIDESLATAIGNGWAFKKANDGHLDKEPWYNQPTIDGFAKALFELTSSYLEKNRPVDKEFIDKAIEIYSLKFPNSIYELDSIMSKIALVHNGTFLKGSEPKSILRGAFFVSSYDGSAPINHEESVSVISEPGLTVLIVFNDDDVKDLLKISKSIPTIDENMDSLKKMGNHSYMSVQDKNAKTFIFIKAKNTEEFKKSIMSLKNSGKIDPSKKVIEF